MATYNATAAQILNDWFNKHHLDRKALAGLAANQVAAEAYQEYVADEVEAVLEVLIQAAEQACPQFQHTLPHQHGQDGHSEPAQPLHRLDRPGPHVAFEAVPAPAPVGMACHADCIHTRLHPWRYQAPCDLRFNETLAQLAVVFVQGLMLVASPCTRRHALVPQSACTPSAQNTDQPLPVKLPGCTVPTSMSDAKTLHDLKHPHPLCMQPRWRLQTGRRAAAFQSPPQQHEGPSLLGSPHPPKRKGALQATPPEAPPLGHPTSSGAPPGTAPSSPQVKLWPHGSCCTYPASLQAILVI